MTQADVDVLLYAIEMFNASPGTEAYTMIQKDIWDDRHGTYPGCADPPLKVIGKYFADTVPELLGRLPKHGNKRGRPVVYDPFIKDRLGLKSARDLTSSATLLLGWFFDHYRLVGRGSRMYINNPGVDVEKSEDPKLKSAYHLLTWVEVFGQQCAQTRILSGRGYDFPGLTVRFCHQPIPPTETELTTLFKTAIAIFLPTYAETDNATLEDWYRRSAAAAEAFNAVAAVVATTRHRYSDAAGIKEPLAQRSLVFRPGWSIGAVVQTGATGTAYDPVTDGQDYVEDGVSYLNEWPKGLQAAPGGPANFDLFHDIIMFTEPKIVRFMKRSQYSWSAGLSAYSSGFREGQISMCLYALGTHLAKSRTVRQNRLAEDNHANKPTYPQYLEFYDMVPFETETKDDKKTYKFPSLRDFAALERIYIPYLSLVPVEQDRTPEKHPEATATLALHDSLDLYKQLDERRGKLKLVVICRAVKDGDGRLVSAEEWCRRLDKELEMEAAKLGRTYNDYKDLIEWTEADGVDPLKKTPMTLVKGRSGP